MSEYKGFYKLTREQRLKFLFDNKKISEQTYKFLLEYKSLNKEIAEKLIENQVGIFSYPYAVATNFVINSKKYLIPMVTEEPSVVAAASNAGKIIAENGGITANISEKLAIGQISFYDVLDFENATEIIEKTKDELLKIANLAHTGIVKLNGGAKNIEVKRKGDFLVVYLYADTIDAMGANILNTMLECIAPIIEQKIKAKKLMSIISNYATSSIVKASCKIKMDENTALKIQKACEFANSDEYRAATNNKGIFNGIDALAIAVGNDFRAIEAAGHCYAAKDGRYKSLTKWEYKDSYLHGSIEIPMPVATIGGSITLNETTKISLEILENPNAKTLAMIAASLGLAQNFAALKALVTDGIQKGHMKLHANSIALFVGAKDEEIDILVNKMIENNKIEIDEAKKILGSIRK